MTSGQTKTLCPSGILLITENTGFGGINTYVMIIARGLRGQGIPVEIAAVWPKPEQWLEIQCRIHGVELTVLARRRSIAEFPGCVRKLADRLAIRQYAVIHAQGHYSNLVARAAALLSRPHTRIVSTVHGIEEDPRLGLRVFYWLDRRMFGFDRATIANSQDTARGLAELGVNIRHLAVILHGIVFRADIARWAQAPLKVPSPNFRLGFVGRLSPEKGCETLIEAADILKRRGCHFTLTIVGDGPERSRLEQLVATRHLGPEVTFVGWQSEVEPYFQSIDIIVVPSSRESLGWTILESMLHGCTVVASRTGGIPEIVRDSETGLLVEPNDPMSLAQGLQRCLEDPALCARLGQAGRAYVLERHTVEEKIDQTIAVYESALR